MPTVRAQRTVDLVLAQSKVIHMAEAIALLEKSAAPLVTITAQSAKLSVDNPTFYHREQEIMPRKVTITAAAAYNADIVVSDSEGNYFLANDCLFIPRTKEIALITAESAGTLTCSATRGEGGTTAAAVVAGDEAYILPSAFEEDGTAPNARMALEVLKTFYTQIMRDVCQVTKTAAATKMYHGNDRLWQQKIKLIEHKIKLEMLALFGGTGSSVDDDSDGSYIRHSVGATGHVNTNKVVMSGNFTRPEFHKIMRQVQKYHYGDHAIFASSLALDIMNGWGYGNYQVSAEEKMFGLDFQRFRTPGGIAHATMHRLLEGDVLGGWALIVPMPIKSFMKMRPLIHAGENRDTRLMTNIKTDDDPDYYKDQIKTELGFEFWEEKKWALVTGITG